ncbi:hypothetical protein ABIA88_009046 [Bradyrhizobium sp. LA6.4]
MTGCFYDKRKLAFPVERVGFNRVDFSDSVV